MKDRANKNKLLFLILVVFMHAPLLVVGGISLRGNHLYVNLTNSLPHWLYIGKASSSLAWKRDHYVMFDHPRYPDQSLIKQIKGLPGDSLEVKGGYLKVGSDTVGPTTLSLLTHTREGEELEPIKTKIVPSNTVFVVGTHPRSFDSRYEKFGLIHQSQIRGQAWPIF
jgi:conjugative transfer signal peptidase TraF